MEVLMTTDHFVQNYVPLYSHRTNGHHVRWLTKNKAAWRKRLFFLKVELYGFLTPKPIKETAALSSENIFIHFDIFKHSFDKNVHSLI